LHLIYRLFFLFLLYLPSYVASCSCFHSFFLSQTWPVNLVTICHRYDRWIRFCNAFFFVLLSSESKLWRPSRKSVIQIKSSSCADQWVVLRRSRIRLSSFLTTVHLPLGHILGRCKYTRSCLVYAL
jgi:hypothetical protein